MILLAKLLFSNYFIAFCGHVGSQPLIIYIDGSTRSLHSNFLVKREMFYLHCIITLEKHYVVDLLKDRIETRLKKK